MFVLMPAQVHVLVLDNNTANITQISLVHWCNILNVTCRISSFWSWFGVNRSAFDELFAKKRQINLQI